MMMKGITFMSDFKHLSSTVVIIVNDMNLYVSI